MKIVKNILSVVAPRISPIGWKEFNELKYWKGRKKQEGQLGNLHYEYFYTHHFGIDPSFYSGKVILDIGCGPRGSLEWASMAGRRIGVDPLANKYLQLGAKDHQMEYMCAPSERIPMPDKSCDAVFSFNSLDHVENIGETVREIKRITKPGGIFLLLVEVNQEATPTEPHTITPEELPSLFEPDFACEGLKVYAQIPGEGLYGSINEGVLISSPETTREIGWLSAKFVRV